MNYYNENDPKAAAWLRELISSGLIAPGEVDERSILDVKPDDLAPFTQCHFFAGIGGWSYALRLAGWPDDRPVWTGSCPCQPFSAAGKGLGTSDERHLWPVFRELIRARKPSVAFGEQVASKAGRDWLSGVFSDLEGMGYQRAGADLCAAGVGAPHIRQRLFWVADAVGSSTRLGRVPGAEESEGSPYGDNLDGRGSRLADAICLDRRQECENSGGGLRGSEPERSERPQCSSGSGGVDNSEQPGLEGHARNGDGGQESGRVYSNTVGSTAATSRHRWTEFSLVPCADGKTRRIEPGLAPLANGIPARVVRLRGYGNAIVPQVAAEFVLAWLES